MTDRPNEATAASDPTTSEEIVPADRRALLIKGGVAAAVAAVAGLGVSQRASAANGDTVVVGGTHTGTNTTQFSGGTTLRVNNGTSGGASIYGYQDGTAGTYGLRGQHAGTSGTGVYGNATASGGRGVYGRTNATAGIGVYGLHDSETTPGTGVIGESKSGTGVVGRGTSVDIAAGQSGRVRLSTVGQSGSTSDTGAVGTIARDSAGNLWYCSANNTWEILAGPDAPPPASPDASGTFVAIDPVRVFDSRQEAYPGSGLLAPNEERTLPVSDGRDLTGVVTTPDAVPAGATAIAYNVTVTGTTGPNFVSVVPGDAAGYTTSSINWSTADQSVANGSIVRIDGSRQVKVFGGDQTGSAHVILDVTGYFT
jgi:hypothetical protein